MRKNIYMNAPLEKLLEETKPGKFSQRLGEIVERYSVIIGLTKIPNFTQNEIIILSKLICGITVTQTMVRTMHCAIMDMYEDNIIKKNLADKIEQLSATQRIMLIESLSQNCMQ
ncbi:MAG: hypothetical protein RR384_01135 [Acidaminococcaceae bacterium]